ncbi:mce related family protein [Mycobacterium kansasii]|uniref:Mce related family protein n=1 Tax=Mycobacterium kansasii TaxID=1768 RepID=A0A1V3XVF5_MYCKA|nr:mce related family protein [Mycobacterium kansasii]
MGAVWRHSRVWLLTVLAVIGLAGCGWRGLNSIPLPGTAGRGPGAFTIQAQLPDVGTLEQNSRVQVGDVTVGNVTKIERQGWHALLTIRLDGDVELPANATATLGQTSLLGSLHIELARPPTSRRGQVDAGITDPAVVGRQLPFDRADPGRSLAAAQWWWYRPDSGHHRSIERRARRTGRRPAQPDRTGGPVCRPRR